MLDVAHLKTHWPPLLPIKVEASDLRCSRLVLTIYDWKARERSEKRS